MAGLLEATIREWAREPCLPNPCGTSMIAYACKVAGVPEIEIPFHQTPLSLARLIRRNGSVAAYAGSLLEPIGWSKVDEPARGGVGVIEIPAMGATCAIFAGRRWVARGDKQILMVTASPIAAWSFTGCRQH